ncbi:class I SAM-dependent methyltransferase [Tamlana sp. 2_MG-2023]|uniref:class I SAM-dependent methyltransferase n=1 Tax=unclassified Tamlana TaxID=2614803 RepID=UPI0026E237DF|nr:MULTISPECIES: class I SAM-dependent methyltransferase [unclassified Tamlana]MDO6759657.1 class I SAM-dependent methyltransferase [Tamlana sp. 2_MG-2023]MDO6791280.1 class I SAM-dependent methyltransferase [Tamlana sp. 1_MG-2023]
MTQPNQLKVIDHTVSGEEFTLVENQEFGFLETTPKPSLDKLPEYYESKDYISHTDSNRNLFEIAYHLVRGIALKRKIKLINNYASEGKILLDIGCGTGDFLKVAKSHDWYGYGIEPNQHAREMANKKTNDGVFDTDELYKFKEHRFDVITLWHVLEHLPDLENQIETYKKLLKPTGTLIVAVPNHKSYDAEYYQEFWAAYDVPRHLWHFSKKSMQRLLSKHLLKIVDVKPMTFDAYYVSLLSEKYKNGRMKLIKGFLTGLKSNFKARSSKESSSLIFVIKNE